MITAIIAPSGAGKSTTIKKLGGVFNGIPLLDADFVPAIMKIYNDLSGTGRWWKDPAAVQRMQADMRAAIARTALALRSAEINVIVLSAEALWHEYADDSLLVVPRCRTLVRHHVQRKSQGYSTVFLDASECKELRQGYMNMAESIGLPTRSCVLSGLRLAAQLALGRALERLKPLGHYTN